MEEVIKHLPEKFSRNVKLFQEKRGSLVELPPLKSWDFCTTGPEKELNLLQKGSSAYLHFFNGVEAEIKFWLSQLNLDNIELLIVYGVGLGYHYKAILPWLKEKPRRFAAFVEDDKELLRAFLETDVAEKLLEDPQAELLYFSKEEKEQKSLKPFFRRYAVLSSDYAAIAYKRKERLADFFEMRFVFNWNFYAHGQAVIEYLHGGRDNLKNFAANMLHLEEMGRGSKLFGSFKGVPAIVCGAGPSLAKNIELLKSLKGRALILAGGTSVNALNVYGMDPHFGVGLDPFPQQLSRILENRSYLAPYFVKGRMYGGAMRAVLGDLLYISGSEGYEIGPWLEEKAGLKGKEPVESGANVVNFSLAIAEKLGCNPILCVGVDLAYSGGLPYAPGVQVHGGFQPKEHLVTKSPHAELVLAKDIEGNQVYTLQKWIFESCWYGEFAERHPGLKIYNCTEGGIGFSGIPNLTLKEAKERFLQEEIDMEGKISNGLKEALQEEMPKRERVLSVLLPLLQDIDKKLQGQEIESEGVDTLLRPFKELYEKGEEEKSHFPGMPEKELFLSAALVAGRSALAEALCNDLKEKACEISLPPELKGHSYKKIFYPSGSLKAYLSLREEKWDGMQLFFYPKGQIKRKIHYVMGKRQGEDLYFSSEGRLLAEAHYFEDKPFGIARMFRPSGALERVIRYFLPGHIAEIVDYDPKGVKVEKPEEDYFEVLVSKSVQLQKTLGALFHHLSSSKSLGASPEELSALDLMKQEMENLADLAKKLQNEAGLEAGAYKEPIWKSTLTRNRLEKYVGTLADTLSKGVLEIEEKLRRLLEKIKK